MLRTFLYQGNGQVECQVPVERFRQALADPKALLWVDIEDPEDTDIECLLEVFELHPLTVEDCIMPNQRPKLEEFDRYLFLVLHGVHRNANGKLMPLELDVCLGENFLITVRTERIKAVEEDCSRVEKRSPIIKRGADFLFYSITDSLVDSYFPVIDELEARIDELETKLLSDSTKENLTELLGIYNELMVLRRTLSPQRDLINRLNRAEVPFIKPTSAVYFRDVYDHLLRLNDMVDGAREVTTMALEAHATIVSNRLNEIMKSMTAMATLSVPLIVITGIYGMNFGEHPVLQQLRGVMHGLAALMMVMVPLMFVYFRKYKWL